MRLPSIVLIEFFAPSPVHLVKMDIMDRFAMLKLNFFHPSFHLLLLVTLYKEAHISHTCPKNTHTRPFQPGKTLDHHATPVRQMANRWMDV